MTIQHQANTNALLSGLIWEVILSFLVRTSVGFTNNTRISSILWVGGNILALLAYPTISSWILRKQTGLWINTCLFAICGGSLSVWGYYMFQAILGRDWTNVGLNIVLVLVVTWKLFPFIRESYALATEWNAPRWQEINELSLIDFLLCRFTL